MSSVASKAVKGRASVLERAKEFESLASSTQTPPPEDEERSDSDSDDDGFDFAELVRSLTSENQETSGVSQTDALQEAFKILDCDEDGFISVPDLRSALKMFENDDEEKDGVANVTANNDEEAGDGESDDEMLREMIAEADFDGDGQISFDDFLKVLVKPDEAEEPEKPPADNEKKKKKKRHRKQ